MWLSTIIVFVLEKIERILKFIIRGYTVRFVFLDRSVVRVFCGVEGEGIRGVFGGSFGLWG